MTGAGPGRRLVVEADGGSRGNPGPAGYGAVVRDADTREVLAEVSEAIGVATNNVAEYQGLIAGLRAAVGIDPSCTVEARLDSRLVVEQMSGRWNIKHDGMRRLAMEARRILPPDRIRFTWVPREQNTAADRLANAAMDAAASGRRPRATRGGTGGTRDDQPGGDPGDPGGPDAGAAPAAGPLTGGPVLPGRPGDATTLVLARHGRTEHTPARLMSGSGSDPELAPEGLEDARRLAAAVASLGGPASVVDGLGPVSRAECSPQRRARQTLDVVIEGMPSGAAAGWQPRVQPEWREISFGAWEGLSLAEVSGRWPDQVQAWFAGSDASPPGGESISRMRDRVVAQAARTLAAHPGEVILVVTHGGPVATVVHEALGSEVSALWRMRVDPCSLSVVRYWPDGGCQVVAVNVTAHLADAGAPGRQVGAVARL